MFKLIKITAFIFFGSIFFSPNSFAGDQFIEQMISTYKANQARFHVDYRGKQLSGQGVVTEIKADPLGTGLSFYVNLNVNESRVACDTSDKYLAASLNKGQTIKFSGQIHDIVFNSVDLRDCQFDVINSKKNELSNNLSPIPSSKSNWLKLIYKDKKTAFARWVYFSDQFKERQNSNAKIWILISFDHPQSMNGVTAYGSQMERWEFDCKNRLERLLAFRRFNNTMGNGLIIEDLGPNDSWNKVDSDHSKEFKYACN